MLQKELNTDVARLPATFEPVLQQIKLQDLFSWVVKRAAQALPIQLVLQQCSKKSCTFLVAFFTVSLTAPQPRLEENESENVNEDKNDDENENENENEG